MKLNELEGFPELGNTIVIDGIEYVKKREPLSDRQIKILYGRDASDMDNQEYIWGFRDAEKHHGIGGGE